MKFLESVVEELVFEHENLANLTVVLPGKRPIVFIKRILEKLDYSGFLPKFSTVEELIVDISEHTAIDGIALWFYAYEIYAKQNPNEDFAGFIKWFPTILKDWDDVLKFSESDQAVLQYMLDEERIKVWAEHLGEDEDVPRRRFLNFWKKMNAFLPELKASLSSKQWATSGMLHEVAKHKLADYCENSKDHYVFIGFNALTPIEEALIKTLLQKQKASCYFQSDNYYLNDERQEAGRFLRHIRTWKEFNDIRTFNWVYDDFSKPKNIKCYEVSGNVSQTKVIPELLNQIGKDQISNTALVLLDENLLPATLDALQSVDYINITMGFPIKNLSFSNAVKQVFHLQKQLEKGSSSYYYNDILSIIEEWPNSEADLDLIQKFKAFIEERNIVYISKALLNKYLGELSYFYLLEKSESAKSLLQNFVKFCTEVKFMELSDIVYENITLFENAFRVLINQISDYSFLIKIETLEQLINQLVSSESIDFQGEPLQGLQVMGLLETRLLNFENVIMLSINEGKLPLGNSQNTYLPFDVRTLFGMHTYLENDSIYAYHFYRLLQDSNNVHLMFNALSSGVNTGEKSRFVTQIEVESPHNIEHIIVENSTEPVLHEPITIHKTPIVMKQLEEWKKNVSVSHLISYLYNPIDFYLSKILKSYETKEIEEELSVRNYGNLIHYALEHSYMSLKNRILKEHDLKLAIKNIDKSINAAIEKLKHDPDFYAKGMNFIHKNLAERVLRTILEVDLNLVKDGNSLEILDLEKKFSEIPFDIDEQGDKVLLLGFIDRVDRLNGTLRIIDYKTAKVKDLKIKIDESNIDEYFHNDARKQALQLSMYHYVVKHLPEYNTTEVQTGIWSFAEANQGVVSLEYLKGDLDDAMVSVKSLIQEILQQDIPFVEKEHISFN